ncbi:MAG TPA: helix-turn-helix domain-containing protein [Actinoplanes sp.]|nr:helix-turn-helix domain-containing protein [Actinoplanes sp.]
MTAAAKRAYRFRFYPTPEQADLLTRTLGCVRKVYNLALQARSTAWAERRERVNYGATSAMLTVWKKSEELAFLNEVSCVPLQRDVNAARNLLAAGLAVSACGAYVRPQRGNLSVRGSGL